ncbi:DUF4912 domain-containing protein [Vulcanococcus limneticus]|uniref:DUF4912 domain-containing protein n=1 Tax=Vulcanococcus limneticus TaxID=2170428 RepID=UPI00398C16F0
MSQTLSSLARMTLRQLRQIASDLGVSLYSRKSKEELLSAISSRQVGTETVADSSSVGFGAQDAGLAGSAAATNLAVLEAELPPPPRPDSETRVVFLPRDPQWAYVFWEISELDRQQAQRAGASQLCLRVADVTGLTNGGAHPHTLQEVPVDSHASEWYLPVPLSDRDYRVELGYRKSGGGWIALASSAVARVPALHPSEQILDQFVPFSLETPPATFPSVAPPTGSSDSNLHERLYQTATTGWRRLGRGSEAFHELEDTDSSGLNASGVGLWASGRNESGAGGVTPRQRAFWLVADAELIVYGATDPSARLTIGDEEVPLSSDGTFRVQVPFRDGQQVYAIQAVAADGEQKRNITLEFERRTPEDNSNPSDQAVAEWF